MVFVLVSCAANAYKKAHKLDTIEAYRAVIAKYPDGPKRKLAEARIEELEFIHAKSLGTPDALKHFLSMYPNSSYEQEGTPLKVFMKGFQTKALKVVRPFDGSEYLSAKDLKQQPQKIQALLERIEGEGGWVKINNLLA